MITCMSAIVGNLKRWMEAREREREGEDKAAACHCKTTNLFRRLCVWVCGRNRLDPGSS